MGSINEQVLAGYNRKLREDFKAEMQLNNIDDAMNNLGLKTDSSINALKKQGKDDGFLVDTDEEIKAKPIVCIRDNDRVMAVKRDLVPSKYKEARFNSDVIKLNLRKQYTKYKGLYKIYNFNNYLGVCNEILSNIRSGQLPRRSYIIGAPNGFGKTSFVNECLITALHNDWKTAPYISLHELAEIRVAEEQRLMAPFSYAATQGVYDKTNNKYVSEREYAYRDAVTASNIVKKPEIITNKYSWSEYINANVLFVHFTDVVSKDLESHVLYQLLSIRGSKGLPTIAMISTSLEPYIKDTMLRELVWNEILEYDVDANSYDRLIHVSCYKKKNLDFSKNDKDTVENDTGIVK